jgi:hypothetical protein
MKEMYTHISVVLDRSGSMSSMASEVTKGFNDFVEQQKDEEGKATLSLVKFDDIYEKVHDFKDIKDVHGVHLEPRGSTALLDAMGRTLEETRATVLAMKKDDQPAKVIFVFITDGEENASTKYSRKEIFAMIKDLKDPDRGDQINWEFVFIGANQDAIAEGASYGIRASSSITFDASGAGATAAFTSLTKGVSAYRSMKSKDAAYAFSADDYDAQEKLLSKSGKTGKSSSGTSSDLTKGVAKMFGKKASSGKSKKLDPKGPIPTTISDLDDDL